MEEKYVCAECGSDDIQIRQWVNPNTLEMYEWCDDENYQDCWCEHCQKITKWKTVEQPMTI